jgi:hypothetical protein
VINTRRTLLSLALLLALGIPLALAMNTMVVEAGTAAVALLVPLLAYALLSGAVQELRFGGVPVGFYHWIARRAKGLKE